MQNGDANAARLLLLAAAAPQWQEDAGALATGLLARQQRGAWSTTVANLWGQLAVARFAQLHEATPVEGQLQASFGAQSQTLHWPAHSASPKIMSASTPASATVPEAQPAQTAQTAQTIQRSGQTPQPARLAAFFPWPAAGSATGPVSLADLTVQQLGAGKPWVTVSALAAVPLGTPVDSGLRVRKTITPVVQQTAGQWHKGDIYRVRLEITATAPVGMTAVTDPIPAGSAILGSGLGRDSALATEGEESSGRYSIAWQERKMDAMRVYYHGLPQGTTHYEYTVRLNQPGSFHLPPTRAEALYAPHLFGEYPNNTWQVEAAAPQQ